MRDLSTERLVLRAWTLDDVDFALDLYSRWEVQRFIGRTPQVLTDRDEAVARVERFMALDHPVHGIWLLIERAGGRRLGTMLLQPIPASGPTLPLRPSGDTEVGWHLHPDAWGHGYATEAAQRLLRHGVDGGLAEIFAITYPENIPSQAVCRRLGMEHLGPTDRYYDVTSELFRIRAEDVRSGDAT